MFSDGFAETWLYTCFIQNKIELYSAWKGEIFFEKINITQLGTLADFFVITNRFVFCTGIKNSKRHCDCQR